jgi:hypothetical protein
MKTIIGIGVDMKLKSLFSIVQMQNSSKYNSEYTMLYLYLYFLSNSLHLSFEDEIFPKSAK